MPQMQQCQCGVGAIISHLIPTKLSRTVTEINLVFLLSFSFVSRLKQHEFNLVLILSMWQFCPPLRDNYGLEEV